MFSRQPDKAIDELKKIILLNRDARTPYYVLGIAYLQKDQPEKALSEFQKASSIERTSAVMSWLGYTYGVMGRKKEAQSIINELQNLRKKKYVRPGDLAVVYIGLGDEDRAFEWLEKGIEERDDWLIFLKAAWWFDSLRSDPRFKALLKKMNFEE